MLYMKLQKISTQLRANEMKLSDALLIVLRCLGGRLPSERLIWLNRELLGYRADDLECLKSPRRLFNLQVLWSPGSTERREDQIPTYRFLDGRWGKLDGSGKFHEVRTVGLERKSIFCNIGIQQLETQLDDMDEPGGALFSMSFDRETGSEFFCESGELERVYDTVRWKLLDFIDQVIEELKLAQHEG